jgi:hypothetical protein
LIDEPGDKRLGLKQPRDLLLKLDWEIARLSKMLPQTALEDSYLVFNCAVTAWHISDWAWEALNEPVRDAIRRQSPKPDGRNATPLQTLVMHECRELAICRLLATGAKHFTVTQHDDPRVSSKIEAGINVVWYEREDRFEHVPGAMVFIYDGEQAYAPAALFRIAREYWGGLLARLNM